MTVLPNLFIIGTQKGGSTSLHRHLAGHPDIGTFIEKEINLFMEGVDVPRRLAELGPPKGGDRYVLDGSINYTRYPRHSGIPQRIREHVGHETPKFIYTLRNPVDRLISQYHWNAQRYGEHRDLLDAAASGDQFVATGQYDVQLAQYLEHFSADQFNFVKFETFRETPETEVNRILEWLGLDPISIDHEVRLASTDAKQTRKPRFPWLYSFVLENQRLRSAAQSLFSDKTLRRMHRRLSKEVKRETVEKGVRQQLLERYFLDSIERTEHLTGLDLGDWKTV